MSHIYLAARYSRFPEMQHHAALLQSHGHHVTSRWIRGDHDIRAHDQSDTPYYMPLWAQEDMDDLLAADVVLSFTEPPGTQGRARGGRHVELGMALALGKHCLIIGPRENVFHWLPSITVCATLDDVLAYLAQLSNDTSVIPATLENHGAPHAH